MNVNSSTNPVLDHGRVVMPEGAARYTRAWKRAHPAPPKPVIPNPAKVRALPAKAIVKPAKPAKPAKKPWLRRREGIDFELALDRQVLFMRIPYVRACFEFERRALILRAVEAATACGVSATQFAREIGISQSTISTWRTRAATNGLDSLWPKMKGRAPGGRRFELAKLKCEFLFA